MRKCSATEEQERDKEAEMYPMLHDDDIPFGARALERGIEVAGIWNSNPGTPIPSPHQPGTPVGSRPASLTPNSLPREFESPKPVLPAARRGTMSGLDLAAAGFVFEAPKPGSIYNQAILPISPKPLRKSTPNRVLESIPISPAQEEALVGVKDPIASEKRVSFHSRVFNSCSNPDIKNYRSGLDEAGEESTYAAAMMGVDPHLSPEPKRVSRFTSKSAIRWLGACILTLTKLVIL